MYDLGASKAVPMISDRHFLSSGMLLILFKATFRFFVVLEVFGG